MEVVVVNNTMATKRINIKVLNRDIEGQSKSIAPLKLVLKTVANEIFQVTD